MAPDQNEFTALILLSSKDQTGVEESLRSVLAPFTLEIREVQRIALRGRLILALLVACDPAHVLAIEEDLNSFSERSGIDVAIDYSDEGSS